ncbi:MAG: B12-binding domain-containing radical SAM protein [Deltaproteobacteria bacterium]|nr:B12-binding domain-containing radical SAM protein [Deltaproteobacteria bacterium]
MHIVFVQRGVESIGVEFLSAVLKRAGHRVSLVFDPALFDDKHYFELPRLARLFSSEESIPGRVERLNPDLVCFSVVTNLYGWASRVSTAIRRRTGVPVAWGGIHPSAVPDRVLEADVCDYVVRGEGEEALCDLVEALSRGEKAPAIRNLSFRRDGANVHHPMRPPIRDIDGLPMPDKELFEKHFDISDTYYMISSRGCPFRCTFCCTAFGVSGSPGKGMRVRFHSTDRVISELRLAAARYRPRRVLFLDDNFLFNRVRLRDLLARYKKEIGLPFECITHPSTLNRETAGLLREAGCRRCQIGIQSLNENVRKTVLKRNESNEQIRRAVDAAEAAGLGYFCDHMLGLPGESLEDMREALRFYSELDGLLKIKCFYLSYFPGAPITRYAVERGIVSADDLRQIEGGHVPLYYDQDARRAGGGADPGELRNVEKALKLLPLLPRSGRRLLSANDNYRLMRLLPGFLVLPLEGAVAVKKKDRSAQRYLKHYARHLASWLALRAGGLVRPPGVRARGPDLP